MSARVGPPPPPLPSPCGNPNPDRCFCLWQLSGTRSRVPCEQACLLGLQRNKFKIHTHTGNMNRATPLAIRYPAVIVWAFVSLVAFNESVINYVAVDESNSEAPVCERNAFGQALRLRGHLAYCMCTSMPVRETHAKDLMHCWNGRGSRKL